MAIATSRVQTRERAAEVASYVGMRGWRGGDSFRKPTMYGKSIPHFGP